MACCRLDIFMSSCFECMPDPLLLITGNTKRSPFPSWMFYSKCITFVCVPSILCSILAESGFCQINYIAIKCQV